MGIENMPIGGFVGQLLGADIAPQREIAAQVQANLMVRDDFLKASVSDPKARGDKLFEAIATPDAMKSALIRDGMDAHDVEHQIVAARKIVDAGKGLGADYSAVPPFGVILTNRRLGLIGSDVINASLLAQSGMRIKALLDGSTAEFAPAKAFPNDPPALQVASESFNRLLNARNGNGGTLPETIDRADYIAAARAALTAAQGSLQQYPEADKVLSSVLHTLGPKVADVGGRGQPRTPSAPPGQPKP